MEVEELVQAHARGNRAVFGRMQQKGCRALLWELNGKQLKTQPQSSQSSESVGERPL